MRQYVGVVLVKPDGSVLAQHRDTKPDLLGSNMWCVVGGAREESESLEEAAVRELLEETGYVVSKENLQEVMRDQYVTEKGVPVERIIFCAPYDGKQSIACYEGQEIRFVSQDELKTLPFYDRHREFLEKAVGKVF